MVPACKQWMGVCAPIHCPLPLACFMADDQRLLMSLQKGKGTVVEFAGLDNYIRLFQDPVFISSTINTITYFIIQVPVMLVLALIISSILNNPRLKFRGFFRTAIFVPCVTSLVAYSLLFKSMFATDGIINQVLVSLHIVSEPIPWLLETFWAKVVIILPSPGDGPDTI